MTASATVANTVTRSLELGVGGLGAAAIVVGTALALAFALRCRRVESAGPGARASLHAVASAARILLILCVAFLLARPAIREVAVEERRPSLIVLVDHTASASPDEHARIDRTADAITARMTPSRTITRRTIDRDVEAAVATATAELRGEPGAQIVLVTDGRIALSPAGPSVPVHVAALRSNAPRLSLTSVDAPSRALRGDPVALSARLFVEGDTDSTVDVELRVDERVVATTSLEVRDGRIDERVTLTATTVPQGVHTLTMVAGAPGGPPVEASIDVEVLDEPLEVLYIEGAPRWTYRFVKAALLRDPSIALRCWLASADPGFPQEASRDRTSLRAFPGADALASYDVVILGDVDPAALGRTAAEDLAAFVEENGGGLMWIAGASHGPKRFVGTPLEPCLPAPIVGEDTGFDTTVEPFHPELTDDGRRHPVLRLIEDDDENDAWIEGRSSPAAARPRELTGHATLGEPKPGAVVLARHPGSETALIAHQRFGRGRVLFVGVDELWSWRVGVEDRYFHRFLGQSARFLAGLDRVAARDGGRAIPEQVDVRPGTPVEIEWIGPSRPESIVVRSSDQTTVTLPVTTDSATFHPASTGLHRIESADGTWRGCLLVSESSDELRARSSIDALRTLASATGGEWIETAPLDTTVIEPKSEARAPERRVDRGLTPLASYAIAFWILAALLAAEWTLRKMARLA